MSSRPHACRCGQMANARGHGVYRRRADVPCRVWSQVTAGLISFCTYARSSHSWRGAPAGSFSPPVVAATLPCRPPPGCREVRHRHRPLACTRRVSVSALRWRALVLSLSVLRLSGGAPNRNRCMRRAAWSSPAGRSPVGGSASCSCKARQASVANVT
jgi:hypothetical protein